MGDLFTIDKLARKIGDRKENSSRLWDGNKKHTEVQTFFLLFYWQLSFQLRLL